MSPSPDLSNTPDKHLVALAIHGREEARRALMLRYAPTVYQRARRIVHDPDVAKDIVQETFITAFRLLRRRHRVRTFSAWICRIATNKAIDYRRRQRLETLSLPLNTPPPEVQEALRAPVAARAERREARLSKRQRLLEDAIDQLPVKQARCIRLRFYENLTPKQIARRLRIPPGTVKTRIHGGMQTLQETLDPEDVEWLRQDSTGPFYTPLTDEELTRDLGQNPPGTR
ncbi:MAG TPA: RNA polymerase sigma factor [Gemmatimonadales bacterium]|nr:RNA polymerase sigma factor [Gemmatimonadales bacterium]